MNTIINPSAIEKKYRIKEFLEIISDVEDALDCATKASGIKTADDNLNFVLRTAGKALLSARESIALCEVGFPDGALSISRNVFEQCIHMAYVESFPDSERQDILYRYFEDYNIQRAKNLKFEAEYYYHDMSVAKQHQDVITSIKTKYGLTKVRDYWWSGVNDFRSMMLNVAQRSGELDKLIYRMYVVYRRACIALHASSIGNTLRIGSDFEGIDMGPWESGHESALFLLSSSLILVCGYSFSLLSIDNKDVQERLNALAELYLNYLQGKE